MRRPRPTPSPARRDGASRAGGGRSAYAALRGPFLGPLFVALIALSAVLLGSTGPASADDGQIRIAHVERTDDGFSVLVDVPAGARLTASSLTATVNGTDYPATAQSAGQDTAVKRVAVLAVDTSDSMGNDGKFAAAKRAATAFVRDAPANVAIGVVTFDSSVTDALEPTTDRAQALSTIAGLGLSRGTRLFDGVLDAVRLSGTSGQRTVVVLSDGADTDSTASLSDVTDQLGAAGADAPVVDVVALDQRGTAVSSLRRLAVGGQVISADGGALVRTFAGEAAVLSRQIAVSIPVSATVRAGQATIGVALPTNQGTLTTQATLPAAESAPTTSGIGAAQPAAPSRAGHGVPHWVMYAGVAVFGVGLLLALVMLVPAKPVPLSAEDRVATYAVAAGNAGGSGGAGGVAAPSRASEPALAQASHAVEGVLRRNRGLEQRIAVRLDGAGSDLKPSEWLLVQIGIFVVAALVGVLLGNVVVGLLFILAGAVGPWIYLGIRRSRRRKAFNSVLPETLQLMSGSLSAGLSLAQSVDTIVREGAEPVASEFRRVLIETRLGVPLEDAFDTVAERFESDDFRWVVMAIRIQRQVGGNLGELLDTVAATMREREYMRRQVAALAAEGKLSAFVLGGLPPLFLLYLVLTKPSYVDVLFTDPRGIAMLVAGALLLGLGGFWMSRLVRVEV